MGLEILLNPRHARDERMIDLCRRVSSVVTRGEIEFIALAGDFWMLLCFFDSGLSDHPLREQGGGQDGKGILPWYQRNHEVLGLGRSPADAAALILQRSRSVRLKARQITGGDNRKHIVFVDLDTREILWPDQLGPRFQ